MLYRALTQAAALGENPSSARRTAVSAGAAQRSRQITPAGAPAAAAVAEPALCPSRAMSFNSNIPLAKRRFPGMINAVVFRFRGGGPADDGKQH